MERGLVGSMIKTNANLGFGLKKREKSKWTDQLVEELHIPVTRKFWRRKVYVNGIDKICAADLVDMQAFSKYNKGVKYLLTVVDIFSKCGWMIPLKNKTGTEVASALQKVFKERKPEKLWEDKGKEFYNKHVQQLVDLYSTENEEKSSVVEHWNRTMKDKMFKYFTANSTRKYIDILVEFVNRYNMNHSSIKMNPTEAGKRENENQVWRNLNGDYSPPERKAPKFSIDDKVRITKKKSIFEKGYTPRWTGEVFTVSEVHYTDPITYKLKDLNGEEIKCSFYEQELQKTTQEKFLVKWVGYPDEFNSRVDNKDLVKV